jgi:hypothetical protein
MRVENTKVYEWSEQFSITEPVHQSGEPLRSTPLIESGRFLASEPLISSGAFLPSADFNVSGPYQRSDLFSASGAFGQSAPLITSSSLQASGTGRSIGAGVNQIVGGSRLLAGSIGVAVGATVLIALAVIFAVCRKSPQSDSDDQLDEELTLDTDGASLKPLPPDWEEGTAFTMASPLTLVGE